MPIKNDREYRMFSSFNPIETRSDDGENNEMFVEGYASTFETYELFRDGGYIWNEKIMPDAFDEADMDDVVFLRDHQGQVYARTKNGLIEITPDDKGLWTKTNLSKTSAAREMYEDIKAENYTQMSFAFTVDKSHFEDTRDGDFTIVTRVIDRIKKVYDISAVAFPANPTTDIGIATRSAFDGEIERLKAERLHEQEEQMRVEREAKIAELKKRISEVIDS